MTRPLVLLTGATGRIGPHVLDALLLAGFAVRVAGPDAHHRPAEAEWVRTDFTGEVDFDALVHGVRHVVHLAAELTTAVRMQRVNADASGSLAVAAERAGVRLFLYSSSVGVYGHPQSLIINESTPVLSLEPGADNRFLDEPYLYDYCLTKLDGERQIAAALRTTRSVTMRFSNVVTETEIAVVLGWPLLRRIWRGGRMTHQIYVKDVAAACLHLIRLYGSDDSALTGPSIYIVSNDHEPRNRYIDLFRRLARHRGQPQAMGCPFCLPRWVDRWKDRAKFRRWSLGYPAGSVRYSPAKLLASGFTPPHGILVIQDRVIADRVSPN